MLSHSPVPQMPTFSGGAAPPQSISLGQSNSPTLWTPTCLTLREKFRELQAHLKKEEKSQLNNLTLHLEELEKEQQSPKSTEEKK